MIVSSFYGMEVPSVINRSKKRQAILAAVGAAALAAAPSFASPFLDVTLLGRLHGSPDAFSNTVAAAPGAVIDYQVIFDMAPVGTVNVQGATTRTITSL